MNIFGKKKKKRAFNSEGQSSGLNKYGIKSEYVFAGIKLIMLGLFFVAGAVLCYLDIRDEGCMIEFSIGDMSCKYIGSLVGTIIMIVTVLGALHINPKVNIK